jgi:hypothetical protein
VCGGRSHAYTYYRTYISCAWTALHGKRRICALYNLYTTPLSTSKVTHILQREALCASVSRDGVRVRCTHCNHALGTPTDDAKLLWASNPPKACYTLYSRMLFSCVFRMETGTDSLWCDGPARFYNYLVSTIACFFIFVLQLQNNSMVILLSTHL